MIRRITPGIREQRPPNRRTGRQRVFTAQVDDDAHGGETPESGKGACIGMARTAPQSSAEFRSRRCALNPRAQYGQPTAASPERWPDTAVRYQAKHPSQDLVLPLPVLDSAALVVAQPSFATRRIESGIPCASPAGEMPYGILSTSTASRVRDILTVHGSRVGRSLLAAQPIKFDLEDWSIFAGSWEETSFAIADGLLLPESTGVPSALRTGRAPGP